MELNADWTWLNLLFTQPLNMNSHSGKITHHSKINFAILLCRNSQLEGAYFDLTLGRHEVNHVITLLLAAKLPLLKRRSHEILTRDFSPQIELSKRLLEMVSTRDGLFTVCTVPSGVFSFMN